MHTAFCTFTYACGGSYFTFSFLQNFAIVSSSSNSHNPTWSLPSRVVWLGPVTLRFLRLRPCTALRCSTGPCTLCTFFLLEVCASNAWNFTLVKYGTWRTAFEYGSCLRAAAALHCGGVLALCTLYTLTSLVPRVTTHGVVVYSVHFPLSFERLALLRRSGDTVVSKPYNRKL